MSTNCKHPEKSLEGKLWPMAAVIYDVLPAKQIVDNLKMVNEAVEMLQ